MTSLPIVEKLLPTTSTPSPCRTRHLARDGLEVARGARSRRPSGRPLFSARPPCSPAFSSRPKAEIPLIGIGGIDSGAAALEKIEAGATLLQLYTGLVYEGPSLIGEIKSYLAKTLHTGAHANLAAIRGRRADDWAKRPL